MFIFEEDKTQASYCIKQFKMKSTEQEKETVIFLAKKKKEYSEYRSKVLGHLASNDAHYIRTIGAQPIAIMDNLIGFCNYFIHDVRASLENIDDEMNRELKMLFHDEEARRKACIERLRLMLTIKMNIYGQKADELGIPHSMVSEIMNKNLYL